MTSSYLSNLDDFPLYKKLPNGRELLFIHIPKTAGTSINRTLELPRPNRPKFKKHYNISELVQLLPPEVLTRAFVFSVVRNPWDRLVSFYFFRRTVYLNRKSERTPKRDQHFSSFEHWVYAEQEAGTLGKVNLRPQWEWFYDRDDQPVVNFIGRFERIEADFQRLCEQLGLPPIALEFHNKSRRPADYRELYNKHLYKLVEEVYWRDIELFGYR